jgi:hypothetical protein
MAALALNSEHVKSPDAVARASLGVRGKARYVNSREFGEPNDRGIRGARCRRGRPEAAAVGGWFSHALRLQPDGERAHGRDCVCVRRCDARASRWPCQQWALKYPQPRAERPAFLPRTRCDPTASAPLRAFSEARACHSLHAPGCDLWHEFCYKPTKLEARPRALPTHRESGASAGADRSCFVSRARPPPVSPAAAPSTRTGTRAVRRRGIPYLGCGGAGTS